jgi:hypothetical protein
LDILVARHRGSRWRGGPPGHGPVLREGGPRIYLAIYVAIYLAVYVNIYLAVYVAIYLAIYIAIYLAIYLNSSPYITIFMIYGRPQIASGWRGHRDLQGGAGTISLPSIITSTWEICLDIYLDILLGLDIYWGIYWNICLDNY